VCNFCVIHQKYREEVAKNITVSDQILECRQLANRGFTGETKIEESNLKKININPDYVRSLMRNYAKQLVDEKTKKVVQAPNYAACALACDRLLDDAVYNGNGFAEDAWKALKTEVLYQRGICELASVGAHAPASGQAATWLEKASVEKALSCFESAKRLVDPRKLDMVKQIELGLLEAMFKSEKKENKAAAEKRFGELENDFGADPRFQRLALELAEWYRQQGRYAEAAKAYEGVADRGRELSDEDLLKTLYMAGNLYSKAAYEAQQKQGEAAYGIYIYPAEALNLGEDILKTHKPLQKEIAVKWPKATMTAASANMFSFSKLRK
jgi:hypothetical protein